MFWPPEIDCLRPKSRITRHGNEKLAKVSDEIGQNWPL